METNGTKVGSLSGRGVLHRHLDKRQLACIGANVADGVTKIELSVAQLAAALRVNRVYIDLARTFSPEKRAAIIAGRDATSFVTLLKTAKAVLPEPQLVLPLKHSSNGNGDEVIAFVRKYGTACVIDACIAVDATR
jgi:hypothetical protein